MKAELDSTPISNSKLNGHAAYAWSLPNIRSMILGHMSDQTLVKMASLSQCSFEAAASVLYSDMKDVDFKKMIQICSSVPRSRFYASAVVRLYFDASMDELDYNEIFARFPIFRIIKTYDITLKLLPSTSNTPLHPSEFLCDLFEVPLTRDVDEYMLASETNGYFPEHWRLRHAYKKVSIQPLRIGDLDPEEDLAIFFNAWKTHRGIFRYPVKKLCFPCPAAAKHLYDIFKQMPHSIHAIPRKMEIAPIEEPGGPSLVDLIMSLCQWVEQLDMAPLEIEHHRVIMTLQDFLRININSKFASLLDGSKVKFKRLNIPLKLEPSASESYDSEDLDALMDNAYPPVNLEEFTITLDLALENGDGDPNPIPALSQIARAMYAIGGTGCRYELRMAGINNRVIRSWVLNNSFQMEMKEVQKNWKPPTIGWRKLAPKEKVRVG